MRTGFVASALRLGRILGLYTSAIAFLLFSLSLAAEGIRGWLAAAKPRAFAQLHLVTQVELGLALLFLYFGISSLHRANHAHE